LFFLSKSPAAIELAVIRQTSGRFADETIAVQRHAEFEQAMIRSPAAWSPHAIPMTQDLPLRKMPEESDAEHISVFQ